MAKNNNTSNVVNTSDSTTNESTTNTSSSEVLNETSNNETIAELDKSDNVTKEAETAVDKTDKIDETPAVQSEELVSESTSEVPAETVVPVTAETPNQDAVVLATQDVETLNTVENVTEQTTPISENDNEHVTTLKIQLAAFSREVMKFGEKPEDYRQAAKLAAQITRHVIQYPKVPVLDTLYDFFKENIKGVCAPENYLKGSTTLAANEEQQVAYLYNLFAGLAQGLKVSVNTALVNNVLKKPEIVNYYHRRLAGLTQNR